MGGHPYWYVVDYEEPLQGALDRLREREFEAGRYNPVVWYPMEDRTATPGRKHASIDDAMAASDADGTRSILDISSFSDVPTFCAAAPLEDAELRALFGSSKPPAAAFDELPSGLFDLIERGMARFVIGYDGERPVKLLFVGYSFD